MSDSLINNKRDHHHVRGNAGPIIVIIVILAVGAVVGSIFLGGGSTTMNVTVPAPALEKSVKPDEAEKTKKPSADPAKVSSPGTKTKSK